MASGKIPHTSVDTSDLTYYCDNARHLVCIPYTVQNLDRMALDLGIKKCWRHNSPKHVHYDIPKRRIAEITGKCHLVSPYDILSIIKGTYTQRGK